VETLSAIKKTAYIAITVFSLLAMNGAAYADDRNIPFQPGERLVFELRWMFVPAGTAVLEVLPIETVKGVRAYHFVLTVRSNEVLDTFYKVRNRIDAYTDTEMTHSIMYRAKTREGSYKRDETIDFDWHRNRAFYTKRKKNKIKHKLIDLKPGSFDPLSALYFVRMFPLNKNQTIKKPVTDGKKCVWGRAKVIRKETIQMDKSHREAWLLEPEMKHIGGVFKKSKGAKIELWISTDDRRLPLKIRSQVVVGHFEGELISIESGRTAARNLAGRNHQ
jgi:hypothetical protein